MTSAGRWIFVVAAGLLLGAATGHAVLTASNGVYNVHIQETGTALGQYTVTTGPLHPAGEGLNVLFGSGTPGTSYNTIHSFSSGTDYVQSSTVGAGIPLGFFGAITPLDTTGFRTTYVLSGTLFADAMTIIQDLKINGSTFSNSTVEVTTTIVNNGPTNLAVGVRYLWDVQVASDDGPTFQQIGPNGPVLVRETEFLAPTFTACKIEDNDVNATIPTFDIFATVNGPSTVVPQPTRPTRLIYAGWPTAQATPFDYVVDTTRVVGSPTINDSALVYYFGNALTNALVIPAGGSSRVSASLFLTPPGFVIGGIEELECQVSIPLPAPTHDGCITRPARFWMTHPIGEESTNCVSLVRALEANGGGVDLGFTCLPTTFRSSDDLADGVDATIEALGLYFRKTNYTGEENGTQSDRFLSSKLCRERKKLGVEIIAATANQVLLGTDPGNCGFATNLLEQAGAVAAGDDPVAIRDMAAVLRQFNTSGQLNDFPGDLVECSALKKRSLRSIGRDPTSQLKCPGINDVCDAAESLVSFPARRRVDISKLTDAFPSPTCATGGADAIWKLAPPVAAPGRNFLVNTFDSNFETLVSVWRGTGCGDATQVNCSTTTGDGTLEGLLQFSTDGTNTYFIVIEGVNGTTGDLKVKFNSF